MLETLLFFAPIILAAALSGAACSLVGFFLTNMRMPFMGVCLAHAALAGALVGQFLGLPQWPFALAAATLTAGLVGPVADRGGVDLTVSLGILFSFMMGIGFMLIGLMPGPRSEALGLIWGSVLFVRTADLLAMGTLFVALLGFVALFDKELRAILFNRRLAVSLGIRATLIFYLLLFLAGAVATVHLNIVGGLMLYGLLVSPAAAAKQLGRSYGSCLGLTVLIGVLGSLGGLALSYVLDVPTGASIVVVLSALFALSVPAGRIRRRAVCLET